MATLILANGEYRAVAPAGDTFTLREMYDLLDCSCVQAIFLMAGRVMWIDDEGKFKPHEPNRIATTLLQEAGGIPGDYIAGNALVTDAGEVD
ncbi:DUF3846 domain-containing protein [Desulfurivibrio sp. D14AmB]|uniref:DUF3846 domain-containing protein n=1 Tax=Desulfurivibrio sp. D14AmB TaxID=3374370 RepID=UPI00376EAD17